MANILYLLPCAVFLLASAYHGPDLPPGPYCGKYGVCCNARQDGCHHEILGTLCYCDEHCNRDHDDCCPDYEEVCLGIVQNITLGPCELGATKTRLCHQCVCELDDRGNLDWRCDEDACVISDDVIHQVNRGRHGWRAANYTDLAVRKLKDAIVYKLGTQPLSRETQRMFPLRYDKDIAYPSHFDSRRTWPEFITPIIDQGWCGSDWAVTIAAIASDRLAIQSNGAETIQLSPQTLLSCNKDEQRGCKGGHIDIAWNFVRNHGLVDIFCHPFTGTDSKCPFKRRGTLIDDGCVPFDPKRTSRYQVGPPGKLQKEKDIMYDIMESGPVHAIMTVYQDFFHYREGIYRHTYTGDQQLQGLHSVRIVGWGEERGEKYWIVANSWGYDWGENGNFRIAKGTNESGIESFVISVLSEVSGAY